MTNDELAARQIVLEVFAMAALSAVMKWQKAKLTPEQSLPVLDGVKKAVIGRLNEESSRISAEGMAEGSAYLDHLLSEFSEWMLPRSGQ